MQKGGILVSVKSKITINRAVLNQLSQAAVTALEQTAEELHTEVVQAQVVPRDTGALQGEKFSVDTSKSSQGKVSLVHEGPYARRLYYHPEYNFHQAEWKDNQGKKHGFNPNAKGKWFEDWQKGGKHQDFCAKTFSGIYKRVAKL